MFDRPKMQARGNRVEESQLDKEHMGGTVGERLSEARTKYRSNWSNVIAEDSLDRWHAM